MAYISESDLLAKLPAATLLEAMDDNGDGTADTGVLTSVIASASAEIDGQLSGRHAVPFTGDIPPLVIHACTIFVLEMLYERRGWMDGNNRNPWSSKARELRSQIKDVAMGTRPLSPAKDQATKNTIVILGESKLTTDDGLLDA